MDSGILHSSEIRSLYVNRLKDLGNIQTINKTKLKENLTKHFPGVQEEGYESKIVWRNEVSQKSPTFMFWGFILRYETLILIFIQTHRS